MQVSECTLDPLAAVLPGLGQVTIPFGQGSLGRAGTRLWLGTGPGTQKPQLASMSSRAGAATTVPPLLIPISVSDKGDKEAHSAAKPKSASAQPAAARKGTLKPDPALACNRARGRARTLRRGPADPLYERGSMPTASAPCCTTAALGHRTGGARRRRAPAPCGSGGLGGPLTRRYRRLAAAGWCWRAAPPRPPPPPLHAPTRWQAGLWVLRLQ